MRVYVGIDLHSSNCYLVVLNEEEHVLFEKRLANDLGKILQALAPFREGIVGIVVESTFNWYWLVDGLMGEGYIVHLAKVRHRPMFALLESIAGVGKILGLTIMLETGDVKRFVKAGNYASYRRCVGSTKISNGKRKGKGNVKNGNRYLAWAFIEAANFAVRYYPKIKRFYERKRARTNGILAIKAVAHKLARATYHVMKDETPFDIDRAFA